MKRTDVSSEVREQYIEEIRELYRTLGRAPKMKEYTKAKEATAIWGGSWRAFLCEAGCQGSVNGSASDEEIEEKYFELKEKLGRRPTAKEFAPYYQMLYRRYGSWKNWLKEIGETNEHTDEFLVDILKTFYKEHKRNPNCKEVPYSNLIRTQLGHGRWGVALRRAGLSVDRLSQHTNAELIEKIQEKAKELGRPPAVRELPEGITIMRHFGTWKNALMCAGLKPRVKSYNRQKVIRNEDLLLDIQIFILKNKRDPYYREYDHSGLCLKRFGKWSITVEMAKRDPYHTMEKAKHLASLND